MPTERITFAGHDGSMLAARLDLPEGPHRATALFAHCFTCSKDIPAARRIAARLAAAGVAVLRFDFTGLGASKGDFGNTTFSTNVADLLKASEYLDGRGMPVGMLIGHSLGGAAVLKTAPLLPELKAVVSIGAPFEPGHVTHNFAGAVEEINAKGAAQVDLAGRKFTISRDFIEDVNEEHLNGAIAETKAALLVMHAPRDSIVGVENAEKIFRAAKHPKSFVTLDDADHLMTEGRDAEYAATVIAAWGSRYLGSDEDETISAATPEGVVRSSEVDPDGFLQDISHGPNHHALADEPRKHGGSNRGMSPYGFVSAGLAACTAMTLRMYARRKKWPLEHVYVDVTHDKVHGEDAGSEGKSKIDRFSRSISLRGELDEDQRARLLEIADKCPVHRTLGETNQVETRFASETG